MSQRKIAAHSPSKRQKTEEQQIADRNLRRRTRYAEMSPERKQLLLSERRLKRAESKRQKLLNISSDAKDSVVPGSQAQQPALVTTINPLSAIQQDQLGTSANRLINSPFFEVGSTSATGDAKNHYSSTHNTKRDAYLIVFGVGFGHAVSNLHVDGFRSSFFIWLCSEDLIKEGEAKTDELNMMFSIVHIRNILTLKNHNQ